MIQIDELQIRMPDNNKNDGNELGRQVAERLANAIPEDYGNQHIPELNIRWQGAASHSISQMADHIVEQILQEIKNAKL
ncbi:hypothetical protein EI546_08925 [Aequorivita sp. H23M31]|uniref:Uncharacterized protein n=1 Tax=Aequorivita ciconiae TaxID=2494375 RepID=A0A410G3H8_9FLAO|nr:hypothetical protein [Aequorivita sp. H23M31]QAA81832.1 hypothetical protein EI546_08925 [Aequorivita sp. H23M31]